jgi:hypothetical protein
MRVLAFGMLLHRPEGGVDEAFQCRHAGGGDGDVRAVGHLEVEGQLAARLARRGGLGWRAGFAVRGPEVRVGEDGVGGVEGARQGGRVREVALDDLGADAAEGLGGGGGRVAGEAADVPGGQGEERPRDRGALVAGRADDDDDLLVGGCHGDLRCDRRVVRRRAGVREKRQLSFYAPEGWKRVETCNADID